MGLIAAAFKTEPDTAAGIVADLKASIGRLTADREKAAAAVAAIPEAIDRAILAEDDKQADQLEKKLGANRRELRRIELAMPVLARNLFEAEEKQRGLFIAKHRGRMLAALDNTAAALASVIRANAAAQDAFAAAAADLGPGVAAVYVPSAAFGRVTAEMAEQFSLGMEEVLGRRVRPAPAARGVQIVIRTGFGPYAPGDTISISDAQAHALVESGDATFVDLDGVPARPIKPSQAEPPKPDANGRVGLVIVRATMGVRVLPYEEDGAFQPGEVITVPLAQGVRFVRAGYAEFIPAAAVELEESTT